MPVIDVHKDTEALTLTFVAEFAADVERVWQVWADPRQLERWWGPPEWPATFEEHELSAGGRCRYYMTGPGGEKARGWWTVTAVDQQESKLDLARRLGADRALTPQQAEEDGVRAGAVVEAAGHPRAFETAVRLTAPGGTTVTVGLPAPGALAEISPLVLTAEARTIVGSYLGSAVPSRDIPRFEQLWREGRLPLEELISGTIDLDQPLVEAPSVRLVCEITSPASATVDWTLKMHAYAQARIPCYLVAEPERGLRVRSREVAREAAVDFARRRGFGDHCRQPHH